MICTMTTLDIDREKMVDVMVPVKPPYFWGVVYLMLLVGKLVNGFGN